MQTLHGFGWQLTLSTEYYWVAFELLAAVRLHEILAIEHLEQMLFCPDCNEQNALCEKSMLFYLRIFFVLLIGRPTRQREKCWKTRISRWNHERRGKMIRRQIRIDRWRVCEHDWRTTVNRTIIIYGRREKWLLSKLERLSRYFCSLISAL